MIGPAVIDWLNGMARADIRRRYRVPNPLCQHVRRGRVFAGDPTSGGYASTAVCDRPYCIADAKEWAWAVARQPAEHVRDEDR